MHLTRIPTNARSGSIPRRDTNLSNQPETQTHPLGSGETLYLIECLFVCRHNFPVPFFRSSGIVICARGLSWCHGHLHHTTQGENKMWKIQRVPGGACFGLFTRRNGTRMAPGRVRFGYTNGAPSTIDSRLLALPRVM